MATPSLAQPAHSSTPDLEHVSGVAVRVLRGQKLYQEHAEEIRFEDGVWLVPSQHNATSIYEVHLGRRGESCECQDFEHRGGSCKHVVAATIARAKTAPCVGCGRRFPHRELIEVQEDHQNLTWFVGDRLCVEGCARAHGVL
jgi:hypothetical protein